MTSSPGDDGAVLLEIPLELQGKGLVAVLAKWAKAPQTRKFELEQVGAFVWEQCDGKQTFETISKKLRDRFKMNRLEADAALAAFLQMLSQRGLILLTVAKDK